MAEDRRDVVAVRERLLTEASEAFPRWEARGQWKDPDRLLASFRERLEQSRGLEELLSRKEIPDPVVEPILHFLLALFDDETVPTVSPPEWREARPQVEAFERGLAGKARTLEAAAEILRELGDTAVAAELAPYAARLQKAADEQRVFREYSEQRPPPGSPIIREAGAPKMPSTVFAEYTERFLMEGSTLTENERRSLVVRLVTDFWPGTTAAKLRERLRGAERRQKDRDRRLREKPEVQHPR